MTELPFGVDINILIDDLRIFSWEAADILYYYSGIIKDKNLKSNIINLTNKEDPVTLADLKVNEIIIKRINEKYENISWEILSEENVKLRSDSCNANADWLWVLDPLDGTKDFIQGTGDYAMHLALNYKQKPYLGVVLIPEKNELWISNGDTFWGERRDGSIVKTNTSKNKNLHEMNIVTSKNHRNKTLNKLIDKIHFKNVIYMGSIGCKIASIIKGDSDIYISLSLPGQSSPKDWDFAAPDSILKAAGGVITNIENEELSYSQTNFEQRGIIIASNNRKRHQLLCFQLKEIIEKYDIYPLKS